jgi:uncharacterized protein YciI
LNEAVRHVLFYENGDLSLVPANIAAHRAKWAEFMARGVLLSIGPFADGTGAMGVFTSPEAAEEFAREDPFVLNGVVSNWRISAWHQVTP